MPSYLSFFLVQHLYWPSWPSWLYLPNNLLSLNSLYQDFLPGISTQLRTEVILGSIQWVRASWFGSSATHRIVWTSCSWNAVAGYSSIITKTFIKWIEHSWKRFLLSYVFNTQEIVELSTVIEILKEEEITDSGLLRNIALVWKQKPASNSQDNFHLFHLQGRPC